MKKLWIMLLGAGLVTFGACTRTETANEGTDTTAVTTTTTTETAGTMDNDAMYRESGTRYAERLGTAVKLDTMQQRKAQTTYYNRSRRYGDLKTRYATDTTGMYKERMTIEQETDTELKGYLTPEQWTQYEPVRTEYYYNDYSTETSSTGSDMNTSTETGTGDASMSSGDTKMKTEGDESKMKSGDTKIKTDGDESKYKSGDTKIKSEDGKSKFKSGDTKIKVETK